MKTAKSAKDSLQKQLSIYRNKKYLIGKNYINYNEILKALRSEFEYSEFKSEEQELIVLKALSYESVFGILATGSGKSTAFLLPAFLRRKTGFSLVISPLRALMNQFDRDREWIGTIHGEIEDKPEVWRSIAKGNIHLLLVAPETLRNDAFKKQLLFNVKKSRRELDAIVLDEVHCISGWGHDFRPEYWWVAEHLVDIESRVGMKKLPRVLLTATANRNVEEEVLKLFGFIGENALPKENIIRGPAGRPEIFIGSHLCKDAKEKYSWTKRFLIRQATRAFAHNTPRRVIIYTQWAVGGDNEEDNPRYQKRKERLKADEIARTLEGFSSMDCEIKAKPYSTKGMTGEGKKKVERFFRGAKSESGQVRVIVATSAFGMGMDYNKIPGVLHFYPRNSLSEYWQQIGRAGRGFSIKDREWAEALALYSKDDINTIGWMAAPPALEGVINAFTIPALGIFIAWEKPPGSPSISIALTPKGYVSKFAKYIKWLQDEGILGHSQKLTFFPKEYGNTLGYAVSLQKLRNIRHNLEKRAKENSFATKHYRKYNRYLRIAADSKPKEVVILNYMDFSADKYQTVLIRLNLWCDIGVLERDLKSGKPGIVRLVVKKKELTHSLIDSITEKYNELHAFKDEDFNRQIEVLELKSHEERCKIIQKVFLDKSKITSREAFQRTKPDDQVPKWLV